MAPEKDWHEDDTFWQAAAPFMFTRERWEGTSQEVDLLLALAPLNPGAVICDLGCGPGRFSLEFARRGFRVCGIDRTTPFLHTARKRATEEGLEVEFLEADMRTFVRPNAFDCAISMFSTFGYFEEPADNDLVLENIFRSLKDNGVLIVEVVGKELLARIFQERDWDQIGDAYLLQERRVSKDWSWMVNRWIIIDGQTNTEYSINHWIYSATELRQMLLKAGFSQIQVFGSLYGIPYDQNAQRLIALAFKKSIPG